ncbi:MAG: fused MFS/spermidine synthase [Desulfobaccales bacterium]
MKPRKPDHEARSSPPAGETSLPGGNLGHRCLLAVMAFIAGAAIMVIELSAIRVLAPWFGNSLYTWTGLIGVILTAMSLGYYFGGWLADKKTSYTVLGHILAGAALFILAIQLLAHVLGRPLAKFDVILGPVLATFLLFALPGFFLGSVSPYIIRLVSLLSADRHIGLSAGTVYMVSTIGSVLGTFAAGFWLIPSLDLEQVFWFTGSAVAGLAVLGYLLSWQRWRLVAVQVLLLGAAIPLLITAASLAKPLPDARLLFQKMSYYHLIRVFHKKEPSGLEITELYLDTTREGAQYHKSSLISIPYQRYWELAPLFTGKSEAALFLGGGGFTLPQAFQDRFPPAKVEVVEIDPEVVAVGRRFFRLNNYPRMGVVVDDARRYLARIP